MALLKGLSCLVAGGASGLGRATAQRLVQNGCRVVIADLPSSDGDKVANDLGDNCMFVPTDVRVKLYCLSELPYRVGRGLCLSGRVDKE